MANRRMFAKSIIDTDYFLEMPATSQLLYFHLSIRADDDGFVSSPKRILRMVGSSEDDFKMLIAKQFVIPFDSGVCVIKHWRIHNIIRSDRYQGTIYTQEKAMLTESENKSYELVHQNVIPDVIPDGIPDGIPTVNPVKVRLGKDSLIKANIVKEHGVNGTESFARFWSAYPKKKSKGDAEKAWSKVDASLLTDILEAIENQKRSEQWTKDGGKYIPYPATWLRAKGWEDEVESTLPAQESTTLPEGFEEWKERI